MSERREDQIARLRLMGGGSPKWDLSANDERACRAGADAMERLEKLERTLRALRGISIHPYVPVSLGDADQIRAALATLDTPAPGDGKAG